MCVVFVCVCVCRLPSDIICSASVYSFDLLIYVIVYVEIVFADMESVHFTYSPTSHTHTHTHSYCALVLGYESICTGGLINCQ